MVTEQSPAADSPVAGGAGGAVGAAGAGGWGAWRAGACRSGCTVRARGALERRRTCSTGAVCEGSAYEVTLCDDTKV